MKIKEIERQLRKQYLPVLVRDMGLSPAQARRHFKDLFKQITKDAKREGTFDLPLDMGDKLLEKEKTDEKVKATIAKKRADGIRDEDIRWWWNMPDQARRMMNKIDEVFVYALYLKFTKDEGLSPKEANLKIWKTRPMFGNPDDVPEMKGADRPLPEELKDRVNTCMIERASQDPVKFTREVEKASTFNAWVRRKIKQREL